MGRAPCCDKTKVKRGPWSPEEDNILKNYIHEYGTGGNWILLPQKAGLKRCGKSCRLRWLNYLRPNIKHGGFTEEEDNVILTLYHNIGSRWSIIASHLPERTDNDVKNYWNTKLKKKQFSTNTNNLNFAPTNNMLPNFPIKSDDEILGAQIPLPNFVEIPKNEDNIGYNFDIFSSQDVVTSSSSSSFFVDDNASTSWSIDAFLSAFEFQEKFSDETNNLDYTY